MIKTQVLKHLSGAEKGKRRGSEGAVKRRAVSRGTAQKRRDVGVIEGKEFGGDDSIKYFFPRGSEVPLESHGEQ